MDTCRLRIVWAYTSQPLMCVCHAFCVSSRQPTCAVIGTSHHHHHCYKLWSRLHDLSIIPNWADLATMHCKCSRHDIFADKEVSLSTRCHASLSEANARDAQLISCLHYRQPPGKHTHTPSIAIAHTGGAAHKFAGE